MSDESLFREVDEEVRADEFKRLWQRYGNYITAVALGVVIAVAAFKLWQYWQVKQAEQAAETYFAAAKLANEDKTEDALRGFAVVTHAGYKQLADLRQAALLAKTGKIAEAVKAYDSFAASAADASLRDLARIRAAYLLSDTLKPDELIARIGMLDQEAGSYRHAAREIFGLSAFRTGDHSLAQRYMEAIVNDAEATPSMKKRARIVLQLLEPKLAK